MIYDLISLIPVYQIMQSMPYHINKNIYTLVINAVNTTHAGDYTCNVTNDAGTDSNTITVYST